MRTKLAGNVALGIREHSERRGPSTRIDRRATTLHIGRNGVIVTSPVPDFDSGVGAFHGVDASTDVVKVGSVRVGSVSLDATTIVSLAVETAWVAGFATTAGGHGAACGRDD